MCTANLEDDDSEGKPPQAPRTAETPETPDTPPLTDQTIEEDLLQALGEKKSKNELELLFWSGCQTNKSFVAD